jgi:hypothetical protein
LRSGRWNGAGDEPAQIIGDAAAIDHGLERHLIVYERKILNAPGATPLIVCRLENGGAYWLQVSLRIVAIVLLTWLAGQVLFFAP